MKQHQKVKKQKCTQHKTTNSIIETLQNHFTHELLPDSLSSKVALQRKLVAAIFGGKLFGGSVYAGQYCPREAGLGAS